MTNKSMNGKLRVLLCAAVMVCTACKPQSAEDRLKTYNDRLGSQGELTSTHLIVRWPALRADDKPVTFKVPREYLVREQPVIKNDAGGIEAIYLTLALPEATTWQPMPREHESAPFGKRAEYDKHQFSRKFVIIWRVTRGDFAWRNQTRRQGNGERTDYSRDGTVAGLERYSRTVCREGSRGPASQAFIDGKPADDPSPTNCRRDRGTALLVSPPEVIADNEGVAVSCMSLANCAVNFVSGRRGTEISLPYDDLLRWRELVEPIRNRVDSFVVE